ncbi:MAG: nuclear transport factor 2 family protein [Candidatus Thorarchaeota archaeon]
MPKSNQVGNEESATSNGVKSVALKFVDCINAGDSIGLMALQTEDFTFIDYDGDAHHGRDSWHSYFRDYPDYKIHVRHLITSGNGVAIIGDTTGCHVGPDVEKKWTILWTAEARDESVAKWRIYSDVHEVRENLRLEKAPKEYREKIAAVKSTASDFIDCINRGDSEGLMALQTEDFTLMDYDGGVFRGRDGWYDYFSECPNYMIHVRHVITSGNGVALFGRTTGSHVSREAENRETILWTAEIRDRLVAEWRLYSDIHEIEK